MTLSISTQSALQFLDNPSDGAATAVSLWQSGLIAVRVERYVNFALANGGGVSYLTGITW